MINETITTASSLDFNSWTQITTSIPFIISILVVWLVPLTIYLIIGASRSARTSSGRKLDSCMLSSPNALIPIGIWIFLQGLLILIFIIFPLYLKFIV